MRPCQLPASLTPRAADRARVPPRLRPWVRLATTASTAAAAVLLAGCAAGVGFGIGLAPGLSLNVGVGAGGPSIGLGTGWGRSGPASASTARAAWWGRAALAWRLARWVWAWASRPCCTTRARTPARRPWPIPPSNRAWWCGARGDCGARLARWKHPEAPCASGRGVKVDASLPGNGAMPPRAAD